MSLRAQDQQTVEFGPDLFDVTGAGSLELGDLEALLRPYLRDFRRSEGRLEIEIVVNSAGNVVGCRALDAGLLVEAGAALCAEAQANGAFRQSRTLDIAYSLATLRQTYVFQRNASGDVPRFLVQTPYPYQGSAVIFPGPELPPIDQMLPREAIQLQYLRYPYDAERAGIEARAVVLLTFSEQGRVDTCRPISSTNTARMAYETCRAIWTRVRLVNPPDSRPLLLPVNWMMAD